MGSAAGRCRGWRRVSGYCANPTCVGAGAGAVFAAEWLEDLELLVPLAAGGALVTAVLAAVMGDKVWETITDWL